MNPADDDADDADTDAVVILDFYFQGRAWVMLYTFFFLLRFAFALLQVRPSYRGETGLIVTSAAQVYCHSPNLASSVVCFSSYLGPMASHS